MRGLAAALPRAPSSPANPPLLLQPRPSASSSGPQQPPTGRNRRSSSRVNFQPHNVREEKPPQDRFHEPAFQQAFRNAKALMGSLAGVLGSSSRHLEPDSAIQHLRQTAQNLATFQCPPTRVVGLVGDAGVGKSSLLNSLLDVHGLARVSIVGLACTCVATEYSYHEADTFVINVEEFTDEELRQQFTEMVANYRHNHLHLEEIEIREDRRGSERLAKLARDTFSVMFRGRFNTALLTSGQESGVVETLLSWARERNPLARQSIANTPEECSAQLTQLTSEEASPQGPAIWPYIKKISVLLNAHILSKGLVLVDLPGLRDLNSARRATTERYLLNCDEIFAVSPIGRAITDEGVMSVFGLARQARLSNVGIICTRSEEYPAEEARGDWKGEQAMRIQDHMDVIRTAERDLGDMRERLAELNDFGEDLLDGEEEEKTRLYQSLERQRLTVENRKLELQRYLVIQRNTLVTAELTARYRSQVPDGTLRVFCASNKTYWEHRDQTPVEQALPFLQLSGILDIRRHCMALVSESQLRIALKYMQDEVPNLVSRVELWVQSGAGSADAEQKQAVRATLDQLEAQLRQKFHGRTSPVYALPNLLASDFNENIYQHRNINRWTRRAVNAGYRWDGLNHSTYAAFCRHYGIHTTTAAGYRNWNEEAIETMVRDLSDPWDTFQRVLQDRSNMVVTFVRDALGSATDRLSDLPDDYDDTISPLFHALKSCQRLLAAEVEDICAIFEGRISELRTKALTGLETAFFSQGMKEAYTSANRISGTGSWARKKSTINGKLAQEEQFRSLMQRSRNRFEGLAGQLQRDVQEKVRERLDVITGILDILRSDKIVEESERDPEFRMRVAEETQRAKVSMEEVQTVIGSGSR